MPEKEKIPAYRARTAAMARMMPTGPLTLLAALVIGGGVGVPPGAELLEVARPDAEPVPEAVPEVAGPTPPVVYGGRPPPVDGAEPPPGAELAG